MTDKATANGPVTLRADVEMTIYRASRIKGDLLGSLAQHAEVELDLSGVEEIDSAGVQLLLLAKREAINSGKTLHLVRHSPAVQEIFGLFNLSAFFGDPLVVAAAPSQGLKRGAQP